MPYNYSAAIETIAKGETVFWVEGEPGIDALRGIGLTAVTTIGGSAGYSKYGDYSQIFQGASLVICPDRDKPGVKYAEQVFKDYPDAQWLYPFPDSPAWKHLSDDGGWDVADWIETMKRERLDSQQIRDRICESIEPKRQLGQSDSKPQTVEHFESSIDNGLNWVTVRATDEGVGEERTRIGNHLTPIARVDSIDGDKAGVHLEFVDRVGKIRHWTIDAADLVGDGIEVLRELARRGYKFKRKYRSKLLDYLNDLDALPSDEYVFSDKTGWVGADFLLPGKTYGNEFLRFREIEPTPENDLVHCKGTLEGWKANVAAKCEGNSRLIFALGTAFAAPLLSIVSLESGGFHLAGMSSSGKTTTFQVAASVAGLKTLPLWNTTSNGLEATATAFNHQCMPIDEIRQCDAREVGKVAYMLGNGQGKGRMRRNLTRSAPKTWQLLFLSGGETTMREYLLCAGVRVVGGQEVRMPDVPAVPAGLENGVFETIHEYSDAGRFATDLEHAAREHCGWALDDYLKQLVETRKGDLNVDALLRTRLVELTNWLIGEESDAVICRVAKRFGVVLLGLELAHAYNLLPFDAEQCYWAVQTLFIDWINARGGAGSIEVKQALERIEHLFATSEYSDRIYRVEGTDEQTVRDLLAFRSDDLSGSYEYWVPPAVFNREIVADVDRKLLIAELQDRGWLRKPEDPEIRDTMRRTVNGKRQRFYVFIRFWRTDDGEPEEGKNGDSRTTNANVISKKTPLPAKTLVPLVPLVPKTQNTYVERVSVRTSSGPTQKKSWSRRSPADQADDGTSSWVQQWPRLKTMQKKDYGGRGPTGPRGPTKNKEEGKTAKNRNALCKNVLQKILILKIVIRLIWGLRIGKSRNASPHFLRMIGFLQEPFASIRSARLRCWRLKGKPMSWCAGWRASIAIKP